MSYPLFTVGDLNVLGVSSLPNFPDVNTYLLSLSSTTSSTGGAGASGFNPTLNYAAGTIGQHIGVEWNPQDYPWQAKFDGVTDDTASILACYTAIYNAGGGVMRMPRGTACMTSMNFNFAASRSVLMRGSGEQATFLQKIGATTTPVLNISASLGVLDVYSEFSDFTILGNAKAHHGLQLTTIASVTTRNLAISNCDTGLNSLGCLVSTHYNPKFGTVPNNRGFACAASSGIYPNLVSFFGGKVNSNTIWNVDITHGSNISFQGTDLSGGGTSANLSTGCINTATTIAAESGLALLKFSNCWLEVGLGQPINIQAAGGLHAMFDTTMHAGSEGGRAMKIGAIGSITIINPIGAGGSDTFTIGATGGSLIIGGVATTIVDTSIQQTRINSAGSLATPGTQIKNLQIMASGAVRIDPTSKVQDTTTSFTQGNPIVTFQDGAGAGGQINMYAANGGGGNAAATVFKLTANSSTSRSINAGGTVNVGGADYAEYETKRDDCGVIAKGDLAGFDVAGLLTDQFDLAISFCIKSTDPSFVGGDRWGTELDGEILESARQKVDRIAYSGKVPVNLVGAAPGDWVIPIRRDDGSIAAAVGTAENSVGRVRAILPDGRALVVVKVV